MIGNAVTIPKVDRSELRRRIEGGISSLRMWESVRIPISTEEAMKHAKRDPGNSYDGKPHNPIRFAGSPYCTRGGASPAYNCVRAAAKNLGLVVRSEILPNEGEGGLVLRVTRVG